MKDKSFEVKVCWCDVFEMKKTPGRRIALKGREFGAEGGLPLLVIRGMLYHTPPLAEIVKRMSHVEASLPGFTPFVCPARCL